MKNDRSTSNILTRRRLLARVGLAASAAYMAPAMIGLNAAHASGNSGASGGNSGPSRNRSSGPSRSRPSGPSRNRSGASSGRGRKNTDMPLWLRRLLQSM